MPSLKRFYLQLHQQYFTEPFQYSHRSGDWYALVLMVGLLDN